MLWNMAEALLEDWTLRKAPQHLLVDFQPTYRSSRRVLPSMSQPKGFSEIRSADAKHR